MATVDLTSGRRSASKRSERSSASTVSRAPVDHPPDALRTRTASGVPTPSSTSHARTCPHLVLRTPFGTPSAPGSAGARPHSVACFRAASSFGRIVLTAAAEPRWACSRTANRLAFRSCNHCSTLLGALGAWVTFTRSFQEPDRFGRVARNLQMAAKAVLAFVDARSAQSASAWPGPTCRG